MDNSGVWNMPVMRFLRNMVHFWLIAVLLIPFGLFTYYKSTLPDYDAFRASPTSSSTFVDDYPQASVDESANASMSADPAINVYVAPATDAAKGDQGWEKLWLRHNAFEWIAIFSSACAFGALGSMTSYYARHPTKAASRERSLLSAQLSGMMFAIMITLIFIGGLVKGSLFPDFGENPRWSDFSFRFTDWAKLLVWSFISGFSERLVPDMLDNIVNRSRTSKPSENDGANGY